MRRILAIGMCAVLLWQAAVSIRAEENPPSSLYAQSAVLMDADSGRILYGKNADTPMAMASTTKIMTCIVALENGNPDDIVEVSGYAASMPKVKLYMKQGEHYRLLDLLYALMLESYNDSAVAIAEHIGGSVEGFAAMMNQKARDLGCPDTWFITPNGLDATQTITLEDGTQIVKEHMTTARDLARIMAYCIGESPESESFLAITRTTGYTFSNQEGRSFSCTNHNAFLSMMDGALSGKTGFTNKAGYCYVGALERDGRKFTVALLACGWPNHKTYKWSDTRALMEYGINNYEYRDFYKEIQLEEIPVADGIAPGGSPYDMAYVPVTAEGNDKTVRLLTNSSESVEIKTEIKEILKAPVKAGTVVGDIAYYLEGELVRNYMVVTTEEVRRRSPRFIFEYIMKCYLL